MEIKPTLEVLAVTFVGLFILATLFSTILPSIGINFQAITGGEAPSACGCYFPSCPPFVNCHKACSAECANPGQDCSTNLDCLNAPSPLGTLPSTTTTNNACTCVGNHCSDGCTNSGQYCSSSALCHISPSHAVTTTSPSPREGSTSTTAEDCNYYCNYVSPPPVPPCLNGETIVNATGTYPNCECSSECIPKCGCVNFHCSPECGILARQFCARASHCFVIGP